MIKKLFDIAVDVCTSIQCFFVMILHYTDFVLAFFAMT